MYDEWQNLKRMLRRTYLCNYSLISIMSGCCIATQQCNTVHQDTVNNGNSVVKAGGQTTGAVHLLQTLQKNTLIISTLITMLYEYRSSMNFLVGRIRAPRLRQTNRRNNITKVSPYPKVGQWRFLDRSIKLNTRIIREEKYISTVNGSCAPCCIHRVGNSHIRHSNTMLVFNIYDALSCFILFSIKKKKKRVQPLEMHSTGQTVSIKDIIQILGVRFGASQSHPIFLTDIQIIQLSRVIL